MGKSFETQKNKLRKNYEDGKNIKNKVKSAQHIDQIASIKADLLKPTASSFGKIRSLSSDWIDLESSDPLITGQIQEKFHNYSQTVIIHKNWIPLVKWVIVYRIGNGEITGEDLTAGYSYLANYLTEQRDVEGSDVLKQVTFNISVHYEYFIGLPDFQSKFILKFFPPQNNI